MVSWLGTSVCQDTCWMKGLSVGWNGRVDRTVANGCAEDSGHDVCHLLTETRGM